MMHKISKRTPLIFSLLALATNTKAECNAVGGSCQHRGFWNIYASIPGGDAWAADYVGNDPSSVRITRQAESIQNRMKNCGVTTTIANSSWVAGFRGDLVIVVSGPYTSSSAASYDLQAARQCGVNGYSKFGIMNEPGGE